MRNACMMTDATFADPRKLDSDESNLERTERKIEHASIAADPSDKGMQAIAAGLWNAIEQTSQVRIEK